MGNRRIVGIFDIGIFGANIFGADFFNAGIFDIGGHGDREKIKRLIIYYIVLDILLGLIFEARRFGGGGIGRFRYRERHGNIEEIDRFAKNGGRYRCVRLKLEVVDRFVGADGDRVVDRQIVDRQIVDW